MTLLALAIGALSLAAVSAPPPAAFSNMIRGGSLRRREGSRASLHEAEGTRLSLSGPARNEHGVSKARHGGNMTSIVLLYDRHYFDTHRVITVTTPKDVPSRGGVLFVSRHTDFRVKRTSAMSEGHGHPLWAEYIQRSRLLQDILDRCASFPTREYVVVCGKSDFVPHANLRIPANVARLYANNVAPNGGGVSSNRVHFLPMGRDWRAFRDGAIPSAQQTALGTERQRSILCFAAFDPMHCYRGDPDCSRKAFGDALQDKPWVSWPDERLDRPAFIAALERSKFVLCPRGNGIDTFRFYDTIYAGAIPIVVREPFHDAFEHVPILFVESLRDLSILTESFLQTEYERLGPRRRAYYAVLDFDTWLAKFHSVRLGEARRRQHQRRRRYGVGK